MIFAALADWCCPRRALRWGPVLGYVDHLTRPMPFDNGQPSSLSDSATSDSDGDDLRGWSGPVGGLDL